MGFALAFHFKEEEKIVIIPILLFSSWGVSAEYEGDPE